MQKAAISCKLPSELKQKIESSLANWSKKINYLWNCDSSLWTGDDECSWLGWLDIIAQQRKNIDHLKSIALESKKAGFSHAVVLGMGGSSLAPEVMSITFGKVSGYPQLLILDSTDPAQISTLEKKIDIKNTLFIVSSKSGTTLEPNIYHKYFYEKVSQAIGSKNAPSHFIAITDPGSALEKRAIEEKFWHVFSGVPSIGGRYSVLSDFGMVPTAIMGVDTEKILQTAQDMVAKCAAKVPVEENPGLILGVILGVAAEMGKDKVTLISSPGIEDFGAWLEQLIAESTGKQGRGIIPVDKEELGAVDVYGKDRLFVYLRLNSDASPLQDTSVSKLETAGHAVVKIEIDNIYLLGAEYFRWEIAVAVAGSIIGINPFNQPDVEASKVETKKLTAEYDETGRLPVEHPILEEMGIKLFTDDKNLAILQREAGSNKTLNNYLAAHFARCGIGDYFALLAYVEMNVEHQQILQEIRHLVRDKRKVATCLGFGPRFLHSTGQAYKGGPNSGVFLQITCDDANDLQVPGQKYSFGVVKAAQAAGDFDVLAERNRRLLRVHLGADVTAGLRKLKTVVQEALA